MLRVVLELIKPVSQSKKQKQQDQREEKQKL